MSTSNNCPVRELLRTSLWELWQEEINTWLTNDQASDLIRGTYCPVKIWNDTFESAINRWLSDAEAQQYSEILLTWFRNRTSEQKKLLNALEEKMRIFERDAAEKLKQQIINNSL